MPKADLLIIDDEPNILSSLRRALEMEDYAVEVAGSGAIGLEKLAAREADLVLLDVAMAGMDGLAVLSKIKETKPETLVIMMSGHANVEMAVQATKLGAHDFLEKPIAAQKLLITIGNALKYDLLLREHAERKKLDTSMVGDGLVMRAIHEKVAKTAPSSGRVLITGENGTGKELVARAIHDNSKRSACPFIKLNCAAIPTELIESELFGHEKGAFTGATSQRRGKFELADSGTLFLDEVGDMNQNAQAKVLRVLQEGEFERLGGDKTYRCDVRVVAATNKNLSEEIKHGRFREDLFYRLNVVPIELPPLRARREDIPALIKHFVSAACQSNDKKLKRVDSAAVTLIMQHDWPGNVRELRNFIERLVILTGEAPLIGEADVLDGLPNVRGGQSGQQKYRKGVALKDLVASAEREFIAAALTANNHHMTNAAKDLGLERSHLYKKMKALGLATKESDEDGET